ncbi:MAG: hypothetical protein Q7S09_03345 [bacterium]|nr:hypothetical protein [bacterium]
MPEDEKVRECVSLIVHPKIDEDFFAIGHVLLSRSTCLKTQTAALIVQDGKIVSYGYNMCCPQDQLYGLPVVECPRMQTQTGAAYELCKPIHAEIVAVINAFGIGHVDRKTLWHFPGFTNKLAGYRDFFRGKAILYLLGHYWACEECVAFLKYVGITEIKFHDMSGGATLQKYRSQNLTGLENALDVSGCILNGIVSVVIESGRVAEFCTRNSVDKKDVHELSVGESPKEGHLLFIQVAHGTEKDRVTAFGKDAVVKEARILLTKTA